MSDGMVIPKREPDTNLRSVDDLQTNLEGLVDNLADELDEFAKRPVHGRIYPASSIDYRSDQGLIQTASSPSYWGGLWSLTCCKHDMRKAHYFDYFEETESGVLRPIEPLFVFTAAGKQGSDTPEWEESRRRWVASIALVTHAFREMDDYGRFLLEHDESVWGPRMSTYSDAKESDWAREYGDCHALIDGEKVTGTGSPYPDHDHVSGSGTARCGCNHTVDPVYDHVYHKDNDSNRLKFVATPNYWLSWSVPEFYWTVGNSPDRFGGGQKMKAYNPDGDSSGGTVLSQLRPVY